MRMVALAFGFLLAASPAFAQWYFPPMPREEWREHRHHEWMERERERERHMWHEQHRANWCWYHPGACR